MADPDWTLRAVPTPEGVALEIGLPDLNGRAAMATIRLEREEARHFARALLAAAGDASERTFPHPPSAGDHPASG